MGGLRRSLATKAANSVQPLTLIYTDWLPGGLRYWAEGYFARTNLDAAAGKVAEDVSRYGIQFAVQRNFRWGWWSPWLGVGMDVSRNRYSKRYTVDSDGYLLATYPDRSTTAVGISVHAERVGAGPRLGPQRETGAGNSRERGRNRNRLDRRHPVSILINSS
ncbi:MAG: hypothetical protein P8090_17280 [Gammaproteobacteria bacterium]